MCIEDILGRLSRRMDLCQGAPVSAIREMERRMGVCLPQDYIEFLSHSNGAEGSIGASFYLALWCVEDIISENECLRDLNSNLLIFGSDGGGEAYAFDLRDARMPVVEIPFEVLAVDDPVVLAETFIEFLRYLEQH